MLVCAGMRQDLPRQSKTGSMPFAVLTGRRIAQADRVMVFYRHQEAVLTLGRQAMSYPRQANRRASHQDRAEARRMQ